MQNKNRSPRTDSTNSTNNSEQSQHLTPKTYLFRPNPFDEGITEARPRPVFVLSTPSSPSPAPPPSPSPEPPSSPIHTSAAVEYLETILNKHRPAGNSTTHVRPTERTYSSVLRTNYPTRAIKPNPQGTHYTPGKAWWQQENARHRISVSSARSLEASNPGALHKIKGMQAESRASGSTSSSGSGYRSELGEILDDVGPFGEYKVGDEVFDGRLKPALRLLLPKRRVLPSTPLSGR